MTPAQELVDGLLARPWGQVSPSVYETGRVTAFTPWLTGQEERVAFLLSEQRPDGGWGPVEGPGYRIVPTLSAVDALLRTGPGAAEACERGLLFLRRTLADLPPLPDMPAIELISASLIRSVNGRIADPLPLPAVFDDGRYELVKAAFASGATVPTKLFHALEVLGPDAARLPGVPLEYTGTVGASPAATAAWLGPRSPGPMDPARRFLETTVRLHGGPVPVGFPITVFERGWVLSILTRAGVDFAVHPELLRGLTELLGPVGTPTAAGLPADADTTAVTLYALASLGSPVSPDALWEYDTGEHFCTWQAEEGRSVSTNAHVLEAFGEYARLHPEERYLAAIQRVSTWLCDEQHDLGYWTDRWHLSPYYATHGALLALREFGGPAAGPSVTRAVRWLLDTQAEDGSWGVWGGTKEETSYAVQALASAEADDDVREALVRAGGYLRSAPDAWPALWHDKDLYLPTAIVRAAVLAASHQVGIRADGVLVG